MKKRLYTLFLCLGIIASALTAARPAPATLGETADSVTTDRKALSAVSGAKTARRSYQVQEIVSDSTTIREYISPTDIVFAIAWKGLINPDLTHLLGSYADEYHQAAQKTPRKPGQRSRRVKTNRVVVEKWGHMRNIQGRAYVPNLIPPGVSVDDIK
jgi:hypothetical protein